MEESTKKSTQIPPESETKRVHLHPEMQSSDESRQETDENSESTLAGIPELQKIEIKYESLHVHFEDKPYLIEMQERDSTTQKQEFETLLEMHDTSRSHNEKLKVHVDKGVSPLEQLDDEKLQSLKQWVDQQAKIDDLEDEVKNLKMRVDSLEISVKQAGHHSNVVGAEDKKLHHDNAAKDEQIAALMSMTRDLAEEVASGREKMEQLTLNSQKLRQMGLVMTSLLTELINSLDLTGCDHAVTE